jgi:hypothetical protein
VVESGFRVLDDLRSSCAAPVALWVALGGRTGLFDVGNSQLRSGQCDNEIKST